MAEAQTNQVQPVEKFRELVGSFDDAMLVSANGQGQLHGRPMRIIAQQQEGLDDLWFVSARECAKITEIRGEPRVAVILADGKRFLSISGDARVVVDPLKIAKMWDDSWKQRFPEGPKGDNIALIQVRPLHAKYWDPSRPDGSRFALGATKAWIKDESHAEVQLA